MNLCRFIHCCDDLGSFNAAWTLDDGLPDATIEGEIIQLLRGGKPKGGSEEKVGTFRAVLERRLTAAEEAAATDSAAAGGRPEALEVTPVMEERLVYQKS